MFTIKAYNEGATYIENCDSIQIITSQSPEFEEISSGLNSDFEAMTGESSSECSPYHAFIRYSLGNMDAIRPLQGYDRAYILNEQGKTIEAVKPELGVDANASNASKDN